MFRRSIMDEAVVAHVYAQRTLEAGFTTVRNVGAPRVHRRCAAQRDQRRRVGGPAHAGGDDPLSATGGHGDLNGFSPYLHFDGFSGVADGVDDIRKKIRFEVKHGADLIKVLAAAGVLSEEESVGAPQYSQEELDAVVAGSDDVGQEGGRARARRRGDQARGRAPASRRSSTAGWSTKRASAS